MYLGFHSISFPLIFVKPKPITKAHTHEDMKNKLLRIIIWKCTNKSTTYNYLLN